MKITFKLNKKYEFSTIRTAYVDGNDSGYNIRTCIRPTLYEVSHNSISNIEASFISLKQAKEYIENKLKEE